MKTLLERLKDVQHAGQGIYYACCPCHEKRNRSLLIKQAEDELLIACMVGCSPGQIMAALALPGDTEAG